MINTSIAGGPVINPNPSLIQSVGAAAGSFTPIGIVGDLLSTGYNIFANERQFNYQKELNNSLMQREDTAIQRAMADAQNAGLSRMQALGQTASTSNYSSADPSMIQSNLGELGAKMDSLDFSYSELEELKRHNRETELNTSQANADYSKYLKDQIDELIRHNQANEGTSDYSAYTARILANIQKQSEEERASRIKMLQDNGIAVDAEGNPIMTQETTSASGKIGPVSGSGSHSETKPLLLNAPPTPDNTEIFPEDGGKPKEFIYDGITWRFNKHWVLGIAGKDAFPVYEGRDKNGNLVHAWFDPISNKFIQGHQTHSDVKYIGPDFNLRGLTFYSMDNKKIDKDDLRSYEGGKYESKKKQKKQKK